MKELELLREKESELFEEYLNKYITMDVLQYELDVLLETKIRIMEDFDE